MFSPSQKVIYYSIKSMTNTSWLWNPTAYFSAESRGGSLTSRGSNIKEHTYKSDFLKDRFEIPSPAFDN